VPGRVLREEPLEGNPGDGLSTVKSENPESSELETVDDISSSHGGKYAYAFLLRYGAVQPSTSKPT
jgi:hypothetical protein